YIAPSRMRPPARLIQNASLLVLEDRCDVQPRRPSAQRGRTEPIHRCQGGPSIQFIDSVPCVTPSRKSVLPSGRRQRGVNGSVARIAPPIRSRLANPTAEATSR